VLQHVKIASRVFVRYHPVCEGRSLRAIAKLLRVCTAFKDAMFIFLRISFYVRNVIHGVHVVARGLVNVALKIGVHAVRKHVVTRTSVILDTKKLHLSVILQLQNQMKKATKPPIAHETKTFTN
jgi:hypothetical protein